MDVCKFLTVVVAVVVLVCVQRVEGAYTYILDDSTSLGRIFDGMELEGSVQVHGGGVII